MSSIIKFNAQDLLSDSDMVLFTPSEMGCYIRLVSHYWLKGELPTDVSALAKLSGCSIGHFKDIWPRVSEQFVVSDEGVITCPSFDKQRSKAKQKSERMSQTAKKRWAETKAA